MLLLSKLTPKNKTCSVSDISLYNFPCLTHEGRGRVFVVPRACNQRVVGPQRLPFTAASIAPVSSDSPFATSHVKELL